MFSATNDGDKPIKSWTPYIIGMTTTAILSALGTKLVEWGIDELRGKFGTKKPEKKA
jgi:hypothetical protein